MLFKSIPWVYSIKNIFLEYAIFPHIKITFSKGDAQKLLSMSKVSYIKWISNFDCGYPTKYWFVIKDGESSFSLLSSNTRNQVRKGLYNCTVHKIDAEYLKEKGYEVYKSAFRRYKKVKPIDKNQFINNLCLFKNFPNYIEYFGVFFKDRLVGYSINCLCDGAVSYSNIKYHPDYLKYYSSYALIFVMNKYYLNERKARYINDGARVLVHQTNVQNFLINKFKFRKAYCRLNIVYAFRMKILINLLYPIRKLFLKINSYVDLNFLTKVNVLLKQEEIRRSFK